MFCEKIFLYKIWFEKLSYFWQFHFWYLWPCSQLILLVFRRKDLCEARPKPKVNSKKADEYPHSWNLDLQSLTTLNTHTPRADVPPLIEPKCKEPYYTRAVLPIEECRHPDIPRENGTPAPANWVQVYRSLLHQDSITYRRMQTCWYTQGRWTPHPF